jgi:hypothetical protein
MFYDLMMSFIANLFHSSSRWVIVHTNKLLYFEDVDAFVKFKSLGGDKDVQPLLAAAKLASGTFCFLSAFSVLRWS